MKKIISYFLFVIVGATGLAQDYYFKNYQVGDGLSYNTISCILQDQQGFMWFGTKDGLNRFDGYTFKVFQSDPGNSCSLGSNFIRSLHEYMGNIWVGTDSGLYSYNEDKECFRSIERTRGSPILDIANDQSGNLWYIAAGTVSSYDPKTGRASTYSLPENTLAEWVVETKTGEILLATKSQLFRYAPTSHHFEQVQLRLNLDKHFPFIITKLKPLSQDSLLIGTKYHGALAYDFRTNTGEALLNNETFPVFVRDFALSPTDKLWIGTESGVYIYDLKAKRYRNLKKSFTDPLSLSGNAIYSIVRDRDGGMWVGTYFGGINYHAKPVTPFKKFLPKAGGNSISGTAVREIQKDNYGNLWIGTEDAGLNKYDPKTGNFVNFLPHTGASGLSHYNIHGLLPIGQELWIGTFEHGLDVMDIKTGKVIRHYGADGGDHSLRSDFVIDIYQSSTGDRYILTSSGVHRYRPETDDFEVVDAFPPDHHYSHIFEDKTGRLWAGTYWDGLYYYDPSTGKKGVYKHSGQDPNSLSSNVINSIFQDSTGKLWITTENGLNQFDYGRKNFKRYGKKDGLPSNVSYSILESGNGDLWISTAGGMVDFDPQTGTMDVFTKANGLLSDQFNYNSAFKDKNGRMYFGSVYGLISFNPREFIKTDNDSPILFTGLQVNNKEVGVGTKGSPLDTSISFADKIELGPDQSSFGLEFATLNYQAPAMTEYWYRMEGLNEEWVNLKQNHKLNFTELPPGDYVLHLRSRNSQGAWNAQSARLGISILPPFYRSSWAYGVYLIGLAGLFILLLRFYHQRIARKNKQHMIQLNNRKEKELYQAKIEFFTNVAHEIRTPLTLIKGPLEKLLNRPGIKSGELKQDLAIMDKNTGRLLNLVNELLDFRKTENKNLELSFVKIDLMILIREIIVRFTPAVRHKGIVLDLNASVEKAYAYMDEEAVTKILSNLVDNAIKYAENKVVIALSKTEEEVTIIIKNDGKRIPDELRRRIFDPFFRIEEDNGIRGTGIGLSMARSLAELHHGDLTLDPTDGCWNSFRLRFPVHQKVEYPLYNDIKAGKPLKSANTLKKSVSDQEKPVLLIVEDNADLKEFIVRELQHDYHVLQADNGSSALDLLKRHDVQLILSDVKMPVMDGIALCKTVKNELETSHIPFVMLTAKDALDAKLEGLNTGADAYVVKPFSMEYLKAQLNTLLENRKHIMDFYTSSPLSHIKSIGHSKMDSDFIAKLDHLILAHIADPDLNVDFLVSKLGMSRSSLYRKIKDLSNLKPNELINVTRLKRAAELLTSGDLKIFEVAERVGYRSQTSFGRSFQKQFGMTPSQYMNAKQREKI